MKAALIVQNSIAGDFKNNVVSTFDFISKAYKKKAKIAVFPEMNLTGYVSGSEPEITKKGWYFQGSLSL